MIKTIDNIKWSLEDLTGGGCFWEVDPTNGVIYVVTPIRVDGTFAVLKSSNFGATWETKATWLHPHPSKLSEPQVVFDPTTNSLFILTTRNDDATELSTNSLLVFKYSIATETLSSPVVLVSGQKIKSAYSICVNGNSVVAVVSVSEPFSPVTIKGKYAIVEFVLTKDLEITSNSVVLTSPLRGGDTFGAVQVLSTGSGGVELYWMQSPRNYTFKVRTTTLNSLVRMGSTWDTTQIQTIFTYTSEFNDDKLTVIPGKYGERFLSHVWYDKCNVPDPSNSLWVSKLYTQVLLGYKHDNVQPWVWYTWPGSGLAASVSEPTISVQDYSQGENPKLSLTCLQGDINDPSTPSKLRIYTWDPLVGQFIPRQERLDSLSFSWLRGTQGILDNQTSWAAIGLSREGDRTTPSYLSSFNLAPKAIFTTPTQVVKRGVNYLLDASLSSDPDLDNLTYQWSFTPPNSNINLTTVGSGRTAYLEVMNSYGPKAGNFEVTLAVQDVDPLTGQTIHDPSTYSLDFSIPFNSAPYVNWYENPVQADRNQELTLSPVPCDEDGDQLRFQWEQVVGNKVPILSSTQDSTLTISTEGASVLGETLRFCLSIDDGVNFTQRSYVDINVPPIKTAPGLIDYNYIFRSYWTVGGVKAPISKRNIFGSFTTLAESLLSSDFDKIRSNTNTQGDRRYLFVSPKSCLLLSDEEKGMMDLKKVFTPGQTKIQSAWLTEKDSILVLSENKIHGYMLSSRTLITDAPDYSVDLSGFLPGTTFNDIWASSSAGGSRALGWVAGDLCSGSLGVDSVCWKEGGPCEG
jgi:hypothetical protein